MATQEMMTDSQLRMVLDYGVDLNGKQLYKNKNFNNIKTSATADGLYAVTNAIVPLQQHSLFKVERNSSYEITNTPTV